MTTRRSPLLRILDATERNGVDLRRSSSLAALNDFTWDALLSGDGDHEQRLAVSSMLKEFADGFERAAVKLARADGLSWARIGRPLGQTKQAVCQRYGDDGLPSPSPAPRARFLGRSVSVHCDQCGLHIGVSHTGDTASLSAKVIRRHEERAHSNAPVDRQSVAGAKDELRNGARKAQAGRYRFVS